MIAKILFPFLLATAAAAATPAPDHTMEVGIPPSVSAPAPNISLEHFQYVIPGAVPDSVVDYDQMLQLQERIKAVAKSALAPSQSSFGVRVIFALTPDKPAQLRMQVAQAPPAEAARLKQFYDKANALKNFHCTRGLVYIMFDYRVSPVAATRPAKLR
jgi:hypothetical protein